MAALLLQLLLPFLLAMLVHLCWGPVAQSLVRPLPVVELQVGIDPSSGPGDGLVSFQPVFPIWLKQVMR